MPYTALRPDGISTHATALVVENSFITENEASSGSSGITSQTPDVRISGTTFADNGLVVPYFPVVEIDAFDVAEVTLENCTFDSNGGTALQISQILDQTTITVENSTFYGHPDAAIDIMNSDYLTMTITNSTLSGPGTGIVVDVGLETIEGSVTLKNSILAGSGTDCSGTITSGGNNLIGNTTGCTVTLQPSDLTGEACLGSFTDNGIAGQGVIPLVTGSPAIDAGDDSVCVDDLVVDQLGTARSGSCDIGSFEWTSSCGEACEGTCDLEDDEGEENENNEGEVGSGGGCSLNPAGSI